MQQFDVSKPLFSVTLLKITPVGSKVIFAIVGKSVVGVLVFPAVGMSVGIAVTVVGDDVAVVGADVNDGTLEGKSDCVDVGN